MSGELKGKNGKIVGADYYFKDLNEDKKFGCLMNDSSKFNYHETLENIIRNINNALDEIYDNLTRNKAVLSFIKSQE